jgi:hypothetical protein
MNYGTQRFLSALIRAMRKSDDDRDLQIADTLEAAFRP